MSVEIRHRLTGNVICTGETRLDAVEKNRDLLSGADLRSAKLSGANLRGADLRFTDLRYADLRGANLCDADLECADLECAKLIIANLRGACLHGANLNCAWLNGARINWKSHDLITELLKRAADGDLQKLKVAGLLLVTRGMCWTSYLDLGDPLTDWALDALSDWVQKGDGAPDCLRSRVTRQEDK